MDTSAGLVWRLFEEVLRRADLYEALRLFGMGLYCLERGSRVLNLDPLDANLTNPQTMRLILITES